MPTTEPRNALHKAIMAHIEAAPAFASVRVVQGWPDSDMVMPCVAISSGRTTEKRANRPDYRTTDIGGGELLNLQAMADVSYPVRLNLWAATKTERGALEMALLDLLDGPIPADLSLDESRPPGMELTLALYHDVTTRVRLIDHDQMDMDGKSGEFYRTLFACSAIVPRVRAVRYTTVTAADVTLTVDDDVEV